MSVEFSVHSKGGSNCQPMLPKVQPDVCPLGISVLAVSPHPEDHRRLTDIFQHSRWQLQNASTLSEAARILNEATVPVVICEFQLGDGDWRSLYEIVQNQHTPCRFLVTLRHADERTWAQVLEGGGYDCLPKPFRSDEVYRLVSLAWRSWKDQRDRAAHNPRTALASR
jgi:DNA-binding NtrC family response regulator